MSEQTVTPSEQEISALAHQFWEDEGQPEGKADEHWRRAEAQLRATGQEKVLPQPTGN